MSHESTTISAHNLRRRATRLLARVPYSVWLLIPVAVLQTWPWIGQYAQYDRAAIGAGQVWRVITCHLVHCNWEHLFWDAAMFALLGSICERRDRFAWFVCCSVSALSISFALLILQPEIALYRGLSGIDTALFVSLAISVCAGRWAARDWKSLTAIGALLLGLVGKTTYEAATGATLFVDSSAAGFVAVPLSHLVGALTGGLIGLARLPRADKAGRGSRRPFPAASPTTVSGCSLAGTRVTVSDSRELEQTWPVPSEARNQRPPPAGRKRRSSFHAETPT